MHGAYNDGNQTGFYKMGARYYDPLIGRFTQPEPAWSNPMFNTMGGRNLLVGRAYATGAEVGQGTAPMPAGYYRPGGEYNWYSYASNDPVNRSDPSGYWDWGKVIAGGTLVVTGLQVMGTGVWLMAEGVVEIAAGFKTFQLSMVYAGGHAVAWGGGMYIMGLIGAYKGGELMYQGMRADGT